jgi:hypothetical protein
MTKFLKIILVVCILSTFFMGTVLATDAENEVETDLDSVAQVTSVTALNNLPEANLGLNNILNVILISLGVLLILFAIAILIRLKK